MSWVEESWEGYGRLPFGTIPHLHFAMERPEAVRLRAFADRPGGRLLIEGPRRIGKTMLVKQAVHEALLLVIDLKGQASEAKVTRAVRRSLEAFTGCRIGQSVKRSRRREGGVRSALGYLRSSREEETDSPDIESLLGMIGELGEERGPLVVFFDEIQTLVEIPGGFDIADRIRAQTQHQGGVSYVFAGSNSHQLTELDARSRGAFYKQVERLSLGPIPREAFAGWIRQRLGEHSLEISDEALADAFAFARDIPGDVQRVLAGAYALVRMEAPASSTIDRKVIERSVVQTLSEREPSLDHIAGSLTAKQRLLCLAIAAATHAGYTATRTGREMRFLSGIDNPGTIGSTFEALSREGVLTHWQGRYQIDDPFLEACLIRRNPVDYEGVIDRLDRLMVG